MQSRTFIKQWRKSKEETTKAVGDSGKRCEDKTSDFWWDSISVLRLVDAKEVPYRIDLRNEATKG